MEYTHCKKGEKVFYNSGTWTFEERKVHLGRKDFLFVLHKEVTRNGDGSVVRGVPVFEVKEWKTKKKRDSYVSQIERVMDKGLRSKLEEIVERRYKVVATF